MKIACTAVQHASACREGEGGVFGDVGQLSLLVTTQSCLLAGRPVLLKLERCGLLADWILHQQQRVSSSQPSQLLPSLSNSPISIRTGHYCTRSCQFTHQSAQPCSQQLWAPDLCTLRRFSVSGLDLLKHVLRRPPHISTISSSAAAACTTPACLTSTTSSVTVFLSTAQVPAY